MLTFTNTSSRFRRLQHSHRHLLQSMLSPSPQSPPPLPHRYRCHFRDRRIVPAVPSHLLASLLCRPCLLCWLPRFTVIPTVSAASFIHTFTFSTTTTPTLFHSRWPLTSSHTYMPTDYAAKQDPCQLFYGPGRGLSGYRRIEVGLLCHAARNLLSSSPIHILNFPPARTLPRPLRLRRRAHRRPCICAGLVGVAGSGPTPPEGAQAAVERRLTPPGLCERSIASCRGPLYFQDAYPPHHVAHADDLHSLDGHNG